jgi:hypothetical protein
MSSDIGLLIIGASIALVSSLITTVVQYRLSLSQDQINWERRMLEDERRVARKRLLDIHELTQGKLFNIYEIEARYEQAGKFLSTSNFEKARSLILQMKEDADNFIKQYETIKWLNTHELSTSDKKAPLNT